MKPPTTWKEESKRLRELALACGLEHQIKWAKPCFTLDDKNIVLVQPFKQACALMFFKGSLMKDPKKILTSPGENSQSSRWVKFTSVGEIDEMEPILTAYIREAIAIETSGLKVKLKPIEDRPLPAELDQKFKSQPALKKAFRALTPGRQRAYLLFFSAPKQSKTRTARIEKYVPQILAGKGMND